MEDKFVQVQLELELLDVSSFVIQKQFSPIGCALLHNTKEKLVGIWKPIFIFKHGEPTDSRKKVLEKNETSQKGIRIKRKIKVMYIKA